MTKRKIYISGPMTGKTNLNFPAFHAAAESLKEVWIPVNPAENFGGRQDLGRETYMRADVRLLSDCDAIALLSGWRESRGARLEYLVAQEMGLEVIHQVSDRWWSNQAPNETPAWVAMAPVNTMILTPLEA